MGNEVLNEKLMSDEKTDHDDKSFIKRSPSSKEWSVGPESDRLPPSNGTTWAINSSATVAYAESDEDTHVPLLTSLDADDSITASSSTSTHDKDVSDSNNIDSIS